jgi:hypothetical protein
MKKIIYDPGRTGQVAGPTPACDTWLNQSQSNADLISWLAKSIPFTNLNASTTCPVAENTTNSSPRRWRPATLDALARYVAGGAATLLIAGGPLPSPVCLPSVALSEDEKGKFQELTCTCELEILKLYRLLRISLALLLDSVRQVSREGVGPATWLVRPGSYRIFFLR